MALVDYGSSDSEQELRKPSAAPKNKQNTSSKQTFEKYVDKSNPGKIRVNLAPETSKAAQEDPSNDSEPSAKRAKTSGFGGFNALLPAPKRAAATAPGLRKGVNLRTGAEPAFSRDPMPATQSYDVSPQGGSELKAPESPAGPATVIKSKDTALSANSSEPGEEAPPPKKATIFKPLSVARKPQKKKPIPRGGPGPGKTQSETMAAQSNAAPKLSLFSAGDISESTNIPSNSTGPYQPLVYQQTAEDPGSTDSNAQSTFESTGTYEAPIPGSIPSSSNQGNSLDDIAADLNLSASARRQLLGRNQRDSRTASIKVTNFNTDEEYAANEVLRQSGEIVQHNAVRGIAPGKHSLKQLVNAATTQKDALDEHFAAGRRNKSEAGAKYGW